MPPLPPLAGFLYNNFLNPGYRMSGVQLLKVSTRMLLDLIRVMEADEKDYELGCRCKDESTAEGLAKQLGHMVKDFPAVEVKVKDDKTTVSIVPRHFTTLLEG